MIRNKCSLTFLSNYINQFETNIKNYGIPNLCRQISERSRIEEEVEEEQEENVVVMPFMPHQQCRHIEQPKVCIWVYMNKNELESYMKLSSKRKMRKAIDEKTEKSPRGFGRVILIEFMLDVTFFCKEMNYNLKQTSAVLSMFYLTHKYFTDHLYICPEDVYQYFKDFVVFHSILFPPTHIYLFNIEECRAITLYFCTLYLRHLPLIRMLTLPNFGFELTYEIPPEPKAEKEKKGKGKGKGKKDKKGKGSKKSKK